MVGSHWEMGRMKTLAIISLVVLMGVSTAHAQSEYIRKNYKASLNDNETIKNERAKLKADIARLGTDIGSLENESKQLREENKRLKDEKDTLSAKKEALKIEKEELFIRGRNLALPIELREPLQDLKAVLKNLDDARKKLEIALRSRGRTPHEDVPFQNLSQERNKLAKTIQKLEKDADNLYIKKMGDTTYLEKRREELEKDARDALTEWKKMEEKIQERLKDNL